MKSIGSQISREDYIKVQIRASQRKFKYCKVSSRCVSRFREILKDISGPVICLGTRNGREVDLFRIVFFKGRLRNFLLRFLEIRKNGYTGRIKWFERFDKSNKGCICKQSVIGVEINPQGERKDVVCASFDELSNEWDEKFNILYANTLDHAQYPEATYEKWRRLVRPGGYYIVSFADIKADNVGCSGDFTLDDILKFFPGELIYYNKFGNWYQDVIIKKG